MSFLRLSTFCIASKQPDDSLRLMNTLWRSVIELDTEHQVLLARILEEQSAENAAHKEQPYWVKKLVELGILTQKTPAAEAEEAIQQVQCWKTKPRTLLVTCAITFACNFRCVYCIQEGNYQKRSSMTNTTLKQALAWCKEYVLTHELKRITVNLFGGKPTLAYNNMLRTMIGFHDVCGQLGLDAPEFQLVSNGFLLTQKRLKQLQSLGLVDLQVTIDGTRDTHNTRRRHASGQNSYDRIWENVLFATDIGIRTRVLVVVDTENSQELFPLVDYASYLTRQERSIARIQENLEFQFCTVVPTKETCARNTKVLFGKEPLLEEQIARARSYARSLGFRVQDPFTVEVCFREYVHSILIDPEGYLYKCYGCLGDNRYRLGHVSDPISIIYPQMLRWSHLDPWDSDCLSCSVFPLCRGGCQFMASETFQGQYGVRFCQQDLLLHLYQANLQEGIF